MAKKLNFKGLKEFCLNSNAYSTIAYLKYIIIYLFIFMLNNKHSFLMKEREDMNTMYNNPLFSDVVLVTDDGSVFAHKVILVTRSEYFKVLLF